MDAKYLFKYSGVKKLKSNFITFMEANNFLFYIAGSVQISTES